jgi:uncharacterized protein
MKKKRLVGIDVARAIAVIGMVIVNFKVVLGEVGDSWLKTFSNFFYGKAAAIFVVLAGVGIALMTNSAVKTGSREKMKTGRMRIVKRAIFLFVVGLSYSWIWPADILHFYGVYMLVVLLFIARSNRQILLGTAAAIFIFPVLLLFFNYEEGWVFELFHYTDFWTVKGFFRNLFFNGFHPVFPWVAFMLFGLWFGRQDLNDDRFLKKAMKIGLIIFLAIQAISIGSAQWIEGDNSQTAEILRLLFATDPMPPLPIYMLNGMSISAVVISACILIGKRYEKNWLIQSLNRTGQLALTFYVAHVVIGMGIMVDDNPASLGQYSVEFSVLYALGFSLCCMVFATIWLHYKKSGPLEWIMRKLTD